MGTWVAVKDGWRISLPSVKGCRIQRGVVVAPIQRCSCVRPSRLGIWFPVKVYRPPDSSSFRPKAVEMSFILWEFWTYFKLSFHLSIFMFRNFGMDFASDHRRTFRGAPVPSDRPTDIGRFADFGYSFDFFRCEFCFSFMFSFCLFADLSFKFHFPLVWDLIWELRISLRFDLRFENLIWELIIENFFIWTFSKWTPFRCPRLPTNRTLRVDGSAWTINLDAQFSVSFLSLGFGIS